MQKNNLSERKLVFLISKWYPNEDDPQLGVFIRKHAKAISENFDVIVFYASTKEGLKHIRIDEFKSYRLSEYLVYFPKSNLPGSRLIHFFRYLRAFLTVWKRTLLQYRKPDIIHSYILLRPAILAWLIRLMQGIPYIVSEQWSGYATGKYLQRNYIFRWLCRMTFNAANGRTCVSNFLKDNMTRYGFSSNIEITPNIIEIQSEPKFNRKYDCSILMVADMVDDIKNISAVVRSVVSLSKKLSGIHLKLVGHGRDFESIKSLCKELDPGETLIEMTGLRTNEEVYHELWNCDFLIMNSFFETFSLICAEALSCGKPVIATKCGGPQEFINDQCGILIEPGNDKELMAAIEEMYGNYKKYDPQKLRNYSKELFSHSKSAELFNRIIKATID